MPTAIVYAYLETPARVLQIIESVNPASFAGRSDVKIYDNLTTPTEDSVLSLAKAIPYRYLKIYGNDVIEMTDPEKVNLDNSILLNRIAEYKSSAKRKIDGIDGYDMRSIAKIMIDEINTLRRWIDTFELQVSLSSSLADFKIRISTMPAMPDRTLSQAKTAYKALIDGSDLDE